MQRENAIKVLEKTAALLECFEQRGDWSLTEISERLGWHIATVHRILGTLELIGYLRQDPVSRRYRLGVKLVRLGRRAAEELDLTKIAMPSMERLSRHCGETVYLAALNGCEVVYLAVAQADRPVRMTATAGERRPSHSTGTGKVLLAYAPPAVAENCLRGGLEALTPHTLTSLDRFQAEFGAIREAGYGISYQEHNLDVASVAAPVRDASGVVAALAVSGPAFRLPPDVLHGLAAPLLETAREISASLGAGL